MQPGVVLPGDCEEQSLGMQMERQMGCMAGFLQIFDRHQILAGRRGIYSAKRLPSPASPALSCTSPSERSDSSVSSSPMGVPSPPPPQPQPQLPPSEMRPPSPEPLGWADVPARQSLPLRVFDFKDGPRSSWKFRETPRLSLDSRVDGRGKLYPREIRTEPAARPEESDASDNQDKQRRSPSVVARLMGLDALPGNGDLGGSDGDAEQYKRAELRRSASESRASRDLLRCQFVDGRYFLPPSPQGNVISEDKHREVRQSIVRDTKPEPLPSGLSLPVCPPHPPGAFCALQRKSFFDVQDYFVSEIPKRVGGGSLYGEVEKRLRMRGIDEPAKDLETLKQILEVIQLRGLLHPSQRQRTGRSEVPHQPSGRNFVYEHSPTRTNCFDSPIVVMQPAPRSPSSRPPPPPLYSRPNASPPPTRRNQLAPSESPSRFLRRNHVEIGRNPARANNEIRTRGAGTTDPIRAGSPASPVRRRPAPPPQAPTTRGRLGTDRRTSCAQPPKAGSPRKIGSDPATHSPRNNCRPAPRERAPHRPEEDELAGSDGSFNASSQFDFERVKSEYRDGRILLERCDKLLHSIAEITSKAAADDEEQVNAAEQQPSPVSVLDAAASFDRDDAAASPSPLLTKRCIDFKGTRLPIKVLILTNANFCRKSVWSLIRVVIVADQSVEASEEDGWIPSTSSVKSKVDDGSEPDDSDFFYVSEILRASDPHQMAQNSLWSPELKPQTTGDAAAADSKATLPLHRRLVFDAVSEIVERRSQVSPWEAFLRSRSPVVGGKARLLPGEVWAELRRIQEPAPADDLCELICGILRKDMTASAAEQAWSSRPAEMSDAVLDIERLIFKDLVAETIRQLAAVSEGSRCRGAGAPPQPSPTAAAVPPRRRLMF